MRGGGESAAASNPGAQQVQTEQKQTEKALEEAQAAQKKATDEEKRAAEAQAQVQKTQQQLAKEQEQAKLEQEKARQLQEQANAATQQATGNAKQSQQQASQALGTQSKQVQSGQQLISGHVLEAAQDRVVVQPQGGGDPMAFRVTKQTQVQISGQRRSATDLRQGEDARVAYQVSGTQPTAVNIQVVRTNPSAPSSSGSSGTPGSSGSSASPGAGKP
jgi:colicin import membrane protein